MRLFLKICFHTGKIISIEEKYKDSDLLQGGKEALFDPLSTQIAH